MEHQAKLIAKSIKILYKYIWIPRSATANISPNKGIKWKKCIAFKSLNNNKKQYPQILNSILDSYLLNNSTSPNLDLTNQIISDIVTFNPNSV